MEYKVTVATGTSEYSGTNNYIYVTLVGERGESERTVLDNPGLDFRRGAVSKHACVLMIKYTILFLFPLSSAVEIFCYLQLTNDNNFIKRNHIKKNLSISKK